MAGEAVSEGAEQAGVAVADAALQQSGKCKEMWQHKHRLEPIMSPMVAQGFQESALDPSLDARACRKVATDTTLAAMHKHWQDVTGFSDQFATMLLGDIVTYVCGPPLMQTLRATRRSDAEYKTRVKNTLRKSVLTDAYFEALLTSHCGAESGYVFLFAAEPGRDSMGSWSKASASATACLTMLVVLAGLGLLLAAGRRQRQFTSPEASMLLEVGRLEEADASE